MRKLFWVLLLMLIPAAGAYAVTSVEASQFEKANLAYREGKFDEASSLYQVLADKNPSQAVFSYNLGNALQKQGKTGPALVAYERARLAAPRNGDILSNLSYAQNQIEYRIEDKRGEFIQIAEKILAFVTLPEALIFSMLCSFLFLAVSVYCLFSNQIYSWGLVRKVFLLLAVAGFAFAGAKQVQAVFFREAIVTAKEAQVYYGPSVNDQQAFKLGEGLKVYVRDSREGWSRIIIASGETGWIQKAKIAEVRV